MSKEEAIKKLNAFAKLAKGIVDVKEVILYGVWLKGKPEKDDEIETAVVVDYLKPDDDFIECSETLARLAASVDKRIEPTLVERKKPDPVGFYKSLQKDGMVVYKFSS